MTFEVFDHKYEYLKQQFDRIHRLTIQQHNALDILERRMNVYLRRLAQRQLYK